MFENLVTAAQHLAHIRARTGKTILLGLEPEPDCYLETTQEAIAAIQRIHELDSAAGEFVGVCLDTCHQALAQESPLTAIVLCEQEGINIAKVQISASLTYDYKGESENELHRFNDPVYLHQTRIVTPKGIRNYPDLSGALLEHVAGKWFVHFHVPLYFTGNGVLTSTSGILDEELFHYLQEKHYHLEIETYCFDQLPDKRFSVVESIVQEYQFVMENGSPGVLCF
jgi:hypothetical protein